MAPIPGTRTRSDRDRARWEFGWAALCAAAYGGGRGSCRARRTAAGHERSRAGSASSSRRPRLPPRRLCLRLASPCRAVRTSTTRQQVWTPYVIRPAVAHHARRLRSRLGRSTPRRRSYCHHCFRRSPWFTGISCSPGGKETEIKAFVGRLGRSISRLLDDNLATGSFFLLLCK